MTCADTHSRDLHGVRVQLAFTLVKRVNHMQLVMCQRYLPEIPVRVIYASLAIIQVKRQNHHMVGHTGLCGVRIIQVKIVRCACTVCFQPSGTATLTETRSRPSRRLLSVLLFPCGVSSDLLDFLL